MQPTGTPREVYSTGPPVPTPGTPGTSSDKRTTLLTMAKAGDQYDFRTGNLWNYAHRDDARTVARLLGEGLDPEMRNKVGWTALHAAANGGADRVIALLLERGVDVDARCRAGRTPLAEAARNGHLSSSKLLLRSGAAAQAQDNEGREVLELAKGTALRTWLAEKCGGGGGGGGGGGRRQQRGGGRRRGDELLLFRHEGTVSSWRALVRFAHPSATR